MSKKEPHEQIGLRALDEIGRVQSLICGLMEEKRYPPRDLFSVRLALDESLTNAIRHGNRMDPSKQVQVTFRVDDDQVRVEVEDEGQGFCLTEIEDPTNAALVGRPGGRGVLAMRFFMCAIEYNDRGNRVTMFKKRSPSSAGKGCEQPRCGEFPR